MSTFAIYACLFAFAACHPTMYKLNDKKLLEPDLVPVSSTVIPIPIHEVSSSLNVHPHVDKPSKAIDPDSLLTKENYRKANKKAGSALPGSTVKEISNDEFHN